MPSKATQAREGLGGDIPKRVHVAWCKLKTLFPSWISKHPCASLWRTRGKPVLFHELVFAKEQLHGVWRCVIGECGREGRARRTLVTVSTTTNEDPNPAARQDPQSRAHKGS